MNSINAMQNVGAVSNFPNTVSITLTNRCNLNCFMCAMAYRRRNGGEKNLIEIPYESILKLHDILPFVKQLSVTGGEPFLYPHLNEIISMCHKYDTDISIQTNGTFLDEKTCNFIMENDIAELKISCDGATPSTYNDICGGGNFFKLMKSIATISRLKAQNRVARPHIKFNFVLMRRNVAELPKLILLAQELGVEAINAFMLRVSQAELIDETLFFHQDYSDEHLGKAYEFAAKTGVKLHAPPLFSQMKEQEKSCNKRECHAPWETMYLEADGKLGICCGGAKPAGNLNETDFFEAWNDPYRVKIRETVNTDHEMACCRNCRMCKAQPNSIQAHIPDKDLARQALEFHKDTSRAAPVNGPRPTADKAETLSL